METAIAVGIGIVLAFVAVGVSIALLWPERKRRKPKPAETPTPQVTPEREAIFAARPAKRPVATPEDRANLVIRHLHTRDIRVASEFQSRVNSIDMVEITKRVGGLFCDGVGREGLREAFVEQRVVADYGIAYVALEQYIVALEENDLLETEQRPLVLGGTIQEGMDNPRWGWNKLGLLMCKRIFAEGPRIPARVKA